jgi:hypothetical protein
MAREGAARNFRVLILAGTAAITLLALVPTAANAGWQLPAAPLSEPGVRAILPDVTTDPTGRTTVVWYGGPPGALAVQAATRPAGSRTFSAPVTISEPGPDAGLVKPDVATGDDGRTVVAWEAEGLVWASSRPGGSSSFSQPVQVSQPPGLSALPQVAIHPQRGVLIGWQNELVADDYVIQVAYEDVPGSNQFTDPIFLSDQGEIAGGVDLAIGPDGRTTVVWFRDNGTGNFVAQAATSTSNLSSFSSPLNLSTPSTNVLVPPRVATGSDGTTTTVWTAWTGVQTNIQIRSREEGSAFFDPVSNLAQGDPGLGQVFASTDVGTAPDGDTTAVWSELPPGILISTRPARGGLPFSSPFNLATAGNPSAVGYSPGLTVGPGGERTVIWKSSTSNDSSIVRTSSVSTGGGLTQTTAPRDLSEPGSVGAEVSAGPNGLVTVVWWRKTGPLLNDFVVEQATRLRVARLGLPAIKGPGKARRGKPVTYRVRLRNVGDGVAKGLVIRGKGKGAKGSKKAGNLAAGKSKTVKVPVRFSRRGKVRVTFTVTAKNAAKKSAKKVVRVG